LVKQTQFIRFAFLAASIDYQIVGPELPPASFSSNVFGTTMVSLTGGNPVNSAVGALRGVRTASGSDPINANFRDDPIATAPGSDTKAARLCDDK
jgi:hypothetical protein